MYLEHRRRHSDHAAPEASRATLGDFIRRCLSAFRWQSVALAVFGILLPVVLRHGIPAAQLLQSASFQNSLWACALSALFGLEVTRRVSAFPGTTSYSVILPSYAIAFGTASVILLALRADYSGSLLFMSFHRLFGDRLRHRLCDPPERQPAVLRGAQRQRGIDAGGARGELDPAHRARTADAPRSGHRGRPARRSRLRVGADAGSRGA